MKYILNGTLLVLNTISILLIVYIVFEPIPLISSNFPVGKILKINNLIIDLGTGVVISTMFYFLLVFIPEKNRKKIVRTTITPQLNTIVDGMQTHIAYLDRKYSMNGEKSNHFDNIAKEKFAKIKIEDIPTNFYAETSSNSIDLNCYTELDYFYANSCFLKRILENILSIPSIIYEEVELVKILTEIKNNSFYQSVEMLHKNKTLEMSISGIDESTSKYYNLYCKLLKYIKPKVIVSIREIQDQGSPQAIKIPIIIR